MTCRQRITIAALATAVAIPLLADSAEAKLPPECVERFETKVAGHVKAIDEAMHSRGRLADIGNGLLRARGEAMRYIKGKWAKDCADAAPANRPRMNAYIKTHLVPALETLARGFIGVCVKYGNERIDERLAAMAKAAKKGRPGGVDKQQSYLETTLRRDNVLKMCKPILKKVDELKTGKFAELKKEAEIVKAKKALAVCGSPVVRMEKIDKGFADGKSGNLYEIAIPNLDSIEREVKACKDAVSSAEGVGLAISDLFVKVRSNDRPLSDVVATIDRLSADPEALVAKIRKHNKKWKKWFLGKWTREHIKGSGMRKVYKAHGVDVLPRVRNLGGTIVWTYRTSYTNRALAECEEYTFSKRGALKKRRAYACP